MYLYDADGTTRIADCGKITDVNSGKDETSQTYTLPCHSSQLTSFVKLVDWQNSTNDPSPVNDPFPVMNIAEVQVYSGGKHGRS